MIRESYDMDLLLYFPSEEQKSLREIYFEVLKFIRGKEQSIIQKNVALRINKREGYHIDLVPAKDRAQMKTMLGFIDLKKTVH